MARIVLEGKAVEKPIELTREQELNAYIQPNIIPYGLQQQNNIRSQLQQMDDMYNQRQYQKALKEKEEINRGLAPEKPIKLTRGQELNYYLQHSIMPVYHNTSNKEEDPMQEELKRIYRDEINRMATNVTNSIFKEGA